MRLTGFKRLCRRVPHHLILKVSTAWQRAVEDVSVTIDRKYMPFEFWHCFRPESHRISNADNVLRSKIMRQGTRLVRLSRAVEKPLSVWNDTVSVAEVAKSARESLVGDLESTHGDGRWISWAGWVAILEEHDEKVIIMSGFRTLTYSSEYNGIDEVWCLRNNAV